MANPFIQSLQNQNSQQTGNPFIRSLKGPVATPKPIQQAPQPIAQQRSFVSPIPERDIVKQEPKGLFEKISNIVSNKLNLITSGRFGSFEEGIKRVKAIPPKELFLPTATKAEPARRYVKDTLKTAVNAIKGTGKLTPPYYVYRAATGNPVTPKEHIQNTLQTPLDVLSLAWRTTPIAPVFGATMNTLKKLRQKAQGKELTWEDIINAPIEGINEQPGIGEMITDNAKIAQAIDIVFLGAMITRGITKTKIKDLNLKAGELSKASKVLGIKANSSIKQYEKAFKAKIKQLPDTFTDNPIPENMLLRQELTNAFNVFKKAGVIEKQWAGAYEFLIGRFGGKVAQKTPIAGELTAKIGEKVVKPVEKVIKKPEVKPTPLVEKKAVGEKGGVVKPPAKPKAGVPKELVKISKVSTAEEILKKIDSGDSGLPGRILNQNEKDVLSKYIKKGPLTGKITEGPNRTKNIIFGEIADRKWKGSKEYLIMADSGPYKGAFRLSSTPQDSDFFGTKIVGKPTLPAKPVKVEPKVVIPPQEVETKVGKDVDNFVNKLDSKEGQEGFINIPKLKKPDLEALTSIAKKLGTREEQIGEDAFWQQELFKLKRETNIRNITKEVQEKFAPELMVNVLSKIPYVDKDAAVRISRSIQRLTSIKDSKRQQLLYKSASAIKGIENGKPVFGTKIQKVLDDGSVKEDWRYTPAEGKKLWEELTLKERKILRDYVAPLENAKTVFSRELLKQKAGVEKGVEGYIHRYYEDKTGDRFKKIFFKFRKAAPTKQRSRFLNPETGKVEELKGNVENFEKSVIKQMENVVNAEEYNKFIQIWEGLLTESLSDKNPLKKGWVEIRGTLKTGMPTDKPTIFKTEDGYGIAPQVRRQTPLAIKEMYMKGVEDTSEAYALTNAIKSIGRYWQGNVLIYPGTAATNAISGGIQYGTKIINDFYKDGVFGGNFKPFFYDVYSLIDAFNPTTIEKLRPELIGAKVNIATQFGKPKNVVDNLISIGLTPFGMVETYWKRVIAGAELRAIGKKPEDILPDYETFKKVSKESDIYGYNYSNIPNMLEKWRGSMLGAWIYPFATYPYKFARFIDRYTTGAVGEIFKGNKKEGFSRLLTVATIASMIYFWQHKKEQKVGEYVDEMKYPGEFDKTGRIKIGEKGLKERYLRIVKYPWFNFMKVLQAGAEIVKGNKEKGVKEISGIGQEFISEGPLMNLTDLLLDKRDKFSMYKEKSVLWGEVAKSFIPAFRINESISRLTDPAKTKETTFEQAIERTLYMKPSGETRTGFQKKELQYDREEEFLKFAFGINIRSIDRQEYEEAKAQVIQNMVYRVEENENITPKSKQRGIEVLKIFGITEDQYKQYLEDRKERMSESRKKK